MRKGGKSELDSQRELLDSLMGINRNNDRKGDQVKDFRDDRVCKFFITGMCPHDIFVNTKMDEGPCERIHSEAFKLDFQKHNDPFMYDQLIEKEFSLRIAEADRIIKKARQRVEDDKIDESTNPDINPDIIRINGEMAKLIQEAEQAVETDNIDRVQEIILGRFEDLTKEKAAVMSRINELKKQRAGNTDKKLRVCDVCGSFLSIFDSDKRLTDHFMGKQHVGFQYMRDTLEAIRKRREERREKDKERRGGGGNGQGGSAGQWRREEGGSGNGGGRYGGRDSWGGGIEIVTTAVVMTPEEGSHTEEEEEEGMEEEGEVAADPNPSFN
eukprot:gene5091-5595_t